MADLLQDREAVHPRHFEIKDHDIGPRSAKNLQALLTTVREDHVIALPTEERIEEFPDTRLIINHEKLSHRAFQSLSIVIEHQDTQVLSASTAFFNGAM